MSVRIALHVTPRSARDEVVGWKGSELGVRVTAPPEGGKANDAVIRLLAKALTVPMRDVRVIRGGSSRHKMLEIDGIDARRLLEAFGQQDRES